MAGLDRNYRCVEPDNFAITALTTPETASQYKNWFLGGKSLDAEERGGNRTIIVDILSFVNASEDTLVLRDEIFLSFEHKKMVLQYHSIDDFAMKEKMTDTINKRQNFRAQITSLYLQIRRAGALRKI